MSEIAPRVALRVARWGPPVAFALLTTGGVLWHGPDALRVTAAVAAIVAGLLLRTARRLLAPTAVIAAAGAAVVCNASPSNVGWFAVTMLAGWVAVIARPAFWVPFWAGAVVVFGVEWLAVKPDPGWAAWIAGTTFAAFCCWLARRERDLADQLRRAQAGLAERTRAEERNRIAREVHDVVAHSLTVSLLHVTSARLALEDDPAAAARALAEAERLGRAALTEVRQAVGLLRGRDTGSAHAPLPDAGRIPALVDSFRAAGAAVTVETVGAVATLPATTGLAVYRILQEALTNGVRHAPDTATAARLTVTDSLVSLTVDTATATAGAGLTARPGSAGAGGAGLGGGTGTRGATAGGAVPGGHAGQGGGVGQGMGLHSMRQRAEALGGTCTAGPHGAGWRVRAEIPLAAPAGGPTSGPSTSTDVNVLAAP